MSALITHLEAMAAKGDPPEARGYLDILSNESFLKTMHIMLDFIPIVTSVSQVIETKLVILFCFRTKQ
jgi:hypothetical protein